MRSSMHRLLAASRLLIVPAILGCFVLAVTLLCYGALASVQVAWDTMRGSYALGADAKNGKKLLLVCVELVDLFLLATVFLITALGLYELFIDDTIPVPGWLKIDSLDDLKAKLISVVVTILGVVFLGYAVSWNGQSNLLGAGAAIALVIAALTYFSSKK